MLSKPVLRAIPALFDPGFYDICSAPGSRAAQRGLPPDPGSDGARGPVQNF